MLDGDYGDYESDYASPPQPELYDYEHKAWCWPGYGQNHRGVSDLDIAILFDANHLGLSDTELWEIGYAYESYDAELRTLVGDRYTAIDQLRRARFSGSFPREQDALRHLRVAEDALWARLRRFVTDRAAWKRVMLYKIDFGRAVDEDHPVYGGESTALYEQLQDALLNPDRVASVGLQMTIQSIDPAVVTAGCGEAVRMFDAVAKRPVRFVPDPDAW